MTLALAAIRNLAGVAPAPAKAADARIAKATELIRARLGGAVALKSIATAVHLSPERFRHLFMEETGVGFRPYLLWLRLECALAAYIGGSTLTDAAHVSGFSDSAHLSRTFKKMFGISPGSVRPE
jgi:AraC-like DNA-binding protein